MQIGYLLAIPGVSEAARPDDYFIDGLEFMVSEMRKMFVQFSGLRECSHCYESHFFTIATHAAHSFFAQFFSEKTAHYKSPRMRGT